jgi:hypothetical protein
MSKFKVNQFIDSSIDEGRYINFERCSLQQKEIDKCHCAKEQREFSKNFFVFKTIYPSETRKYPECNHANNFTFHHDLATPKKVNYLFV